MKQVLGLDPDWRTAFMQDIPALSENDVHLWWLPLTLNKAQRETALELLSDIQRDKYHRRATPSLKEAYLAGRYYLLHLLGVYSDQTAQQIELSYSRLNKPSLSNSELGIEFNFTDTSGVDCSTGLFAFSRAGALGVDIENRTRSIDISRVVDKRFSADEQALVTINGKIDRETALSIWTRKEAYGKATGKGINFKMNAENLVFTGNRNEPVSEAIKSRDDNFSFAFDDSLNRAWRCEQFQLGEEFVACVVHEGHQKLNFKTFNSLIIRENQTP